MTTDIESIVLAELSYNMVLIGDPHSTTRGSVPALKAFTNCYNLQQMVSTSTTKNNYSTDHDLTNIQRCNLHATKTYHSHRFPAFITFM